MSQALTREEVLRDYRIGYLSRQMSLIGRKEVLTGKAKFGIFGDGKEVPQLAMARAFRDGDIRSGYYRDQTFMLAAGLTTVEELFAQLYADPNPEHEPASAGRMMNAHFCTHTVDDEGRFKNLAGMKWSAADSSPTGSQMPRLVGLAYASRLYREVDGLKEHTQFSDGGNEIGFGTIGNASCAEGMFWEAINAVGVLKAPMLMSIWDDEYGISVHNEHQITKENLSELLSGFAARPGGPRSEEGEAGYDLYTVKGWDYRALCETYAKATEKIRRTHMPAILHVIELTQPQGHSTSGSQERYKSADRLTWEKEHDCLLKMRAWIETMGYSTAEDLEKLEKEVLDEVRAAQRRAWDAFITPIRTEVEELAGLCREIAEHSDRRDEVLAVAKELERIPSPLRRHLMDTSHRLLFLTRDESMEARTRLIEWRGRIDAENRGRYSTHLYPVESSALEVPVVAPVYGEEAKMVNGFEVVNHCFDEALARLPELIAFGEDVGKLGDVNQGFLGLQEKYGPLRVADTGIRECTILGQAIGMAMRGLRPLCEIQYLDYLPYALQIISDDLATLQYRTAGRQKAPVIVRTRGHRLEGIWHSGSQMGAILHLVRGVRVCVPRDMTRAAGMYNTLLQSDDSAIVIEVLNGYRIKERLPENVGEFTVPLGVPEVLREGDDVTLVTYGACCRIALAAAEELAEVGIGVEIIDVQTLLPFDLEERIVESLRKTNRVVFLDEDVPGGASAYMMQEVLEVQKGYHWLDAEPRTLPGQQHRPAYGSDGDYWSKPNREDVFRTVYELMHEASPERFPIFY